MPNRLANETSPYLLQHANNPVDWYPWGLEALAKAKAEQKPIFLSIGYSACHWCHVMEHESFEDPQLARQLNENFVAVKVDREERPDLDHIYMNAVQAIAGRGGWPMSVFLTPDGKPFYGGTYWPPAARMGMPGFDQVLSAVSELWQKRREQALSQAEQLTEHLQQLADLSGEGPVSRDLMEAAVGSLGRMFDSRHGGFGSAPKFPHPMDLRLLLRWWKREHAAGVQREGVLPMVTLTLDKMAAGGMYDQLGGGFHRYSVDERWLVPHFEKMLYDNALLSACYVEAFQAMNELALAGPHAGREPAQPAEPAYQERGREYARIARETLDYVLREMTDPAGGFYSTQDADSEGEEGKFYVWTPQQIEQVLGPEAARTFCYVYDVSEEGNFEGHNILNLPKTLEQCAKIRHRDLADLKSELAECRAKLLAVRSKRVWPGRDEKIIVSWNGLMIESLALAAGALNEPRYLQAAEKAANFLLAKLHRGDGRLLHSWCAGQARFDAYLDDYAALANALVTLYEASFDERRIDQAVELADVLLAQFHDSAAGGFFYTAADHEPLIARHKDVQDSSVPSGNSLAATALVRLGKLCGRADYLAAAQRTFQAFAGLMQQYPTAAGQMLIAVDFFLGPAPELVLMADRPSPDLDAVLRRLHERFLPNKVLASRSGDGLPQSESLQGLFAGKASIPPGPTLYVCERFTCQAPVTGKQAIENEIDALAGLAK